MLGLLVSHRPSCWVASTCGWDGRHEKPKILPPNPFFRPFFSCLFSEAVVARARLAMAESLVPTYEDVEQVYGGGKEGEEARARVLRVKETFVERYGTPPTMWARSPGRVNLIGEHIDYEGYGVLPMAIKHDTLVAVAVDGDELVVGNTSERYPETTFSVDPTQQVDVAHHTWANYFLAAYKGVYDVLGEQAPPPKGLKLLVDGKVPTGAGVSSSSAFVCACALAVLGARGVSMSKSMVADFTCKCERYVGTMSGGMDQAISIMGEMGVAKLIEFNPVRASDVVLPPGATFVVANSLAESNKAETAAGRYNMRTIECRLAAIVMAILAGRTKEDAVRIQTLKEIEGDLRKNPHYQDGIGAQRLVNVVQRLLHDGRYSAEEIEVATGCPLEAILGNQSTSKDVMEFARTKGGYKLRDRACHVYSESARVYDFQKVCQQETGTPEQKFLALGQLMDSSHKSCSELYECSCPELEELVQDCREAGAIGSRLTGAGWGGCTVSLVKDEYVGGFIDKLRATYFAKRIKEGILKESNFEQACFASKPSAGGAMMKLNL